MAKIGKLLLSTAALVGTAATAYYLYKNVKINAKIEVDLNGDEDLDDFSEEEDTTPNYVTLNTDNSPVKEAVEKVAEIAEDVKEEASEVVEEAKEQAAEVVDEVKEAVTNVAEDFSALSDQMAVEESVEEFFNDED